jgi:small subunit ribosomal protein S1
MVGKAQSIPIEISQEEMDEGWWAAVLADEESALDEFSELAPASNQSTDMILVDWERVRSIYENDEIISLQVYGYNRGGLLVQE